MAGRIGQMALTAISPDSRLYITPEINAYEPLDQIGTPFDSNSEIKAGKYSAFKLPITNSWTSLGQESKAFFHDFYNRIHVDPSIIELGNLTSTQVRTINVWNAYIEDSTLQSVSYSNADGFELVQPRYPPTDFKPLEDLDYTVRISMVGSPTIDASYQFNFESEQLVLSITGRRVVVLSAKPKYPLKEALEWKTDILKSYNGEQRIRLRDAPRQIFSIESVLDEQLYAKLKALTFQWAHRVFAIPVWTDAVLVPLISSGSAIIYFDTTKKDFRSFDLLVIWKDGGLETLETLNVYSDRIEVKQPVSQTYIDSLVMPARFANALTGISFNRDDDGIIKQSGDFTVRINKNLESIVDFVTYKSLPVLLDRPLSSQQLSDQYVREIDLFDNGSSAVQVDTKTANISIISNMSFLTFDKSKAFSYRQFVHYLHGRQKTFFTPSWDNEFTVVDDFTDVSTVLAIQYVGFSLYYENRFLYLKMKSGAYGFYKVSSSNDNGDGSENLNLDTQIGFSGLANDVELCCLLKYVRLNSDTVQIKHDVADSFTFTLQTIEVPYEL